MAGQTAITKAACPKYLVCLTLFSLRNPRQLQFPAVFRKLWEEKITRNAFKIGLGNFSEHIYLNVRYHGNLRRRCRRRAVFEHSLQFGNFSVEVCHLFAINTILYFNTILQFPSVVGDEASSVVLQLQAHTLYDWIFLDA